MPVSNIGYLYLIESFDQGLAKIGHGNNPVHRRNQLQTGNPAKLTLVCAVPAPYHIEHAVHLALADYRAGLEWYRNLSLLRGIFCHFDEHVAGLDFDGAVPIMDLDVVSDIPGIIRDHKAFVAEHGEDDLEPIDDPEVFGDMYPLPLAS